MVKVNKLVVDKILNNLNNDKRDDVTIKVKELYSLIKLLKKNIVSPGGSISSVPVLNDDKIEKTFFMAFDKKKGLTKLHADRLLFALRDSNWKELTLEEANKAEKIGFAWVYPINKEEYKNINLKSQFRYRINTQNNKLFSDKNIFLEKVSDKFKPFSKEVDKLEIDKEILKLDRNKKYLIKDPLGTLGWNIYSVDQYLEFDEKKKKDVLSKFLNKNKAQITEFIDAFTVKKTVKIGKKLLNDPNEERKVSIRFVCNIFVTKDKIKIYRGKYLHYKLAPNPVSSNQEDDIKDLGTYVPNVIGFSEDRINLVNLKISNTFKTIRDMKSEFGVNGTFYNLVYISEQDLIEQKGSEFVDDIKTKVDEFLEEYFKNISNELYCSNDYLFNNHFKGCFNIVGFDSIYSENGDFKVLEINTNPQGKDIPILELNIGTMNRDTVLLMENKNQCLWQLKFVCEIDRPKFDKLYYISNMKAKNHPTIINLLKEQNYLRTPITLSPPFPTNKYIDFHFTNTENKIYKIDNQKVFEEEEEEEDDNFTYFDLLKLYNLVRDLLDQNDLNEKYTDNKTFYDFESKILPALLYVLPAKNFPINYLSDDDKKYMNTLKEILDDITLTNYAENFDKQNFIKVQYLINNIKNILGNKKNLYDKLSQSEYEIDFIKFTKDDINNNKINNFINKTRNNQFCNSFILKPDKGAQGKGISFIKDFNDFKSWSEKPSEYKNWTLSNLYDSHTLIPLNAKYKQGSHRKYHIRVYYLIIKNKDDSWQLWKLKIPLIYFAIMPYPECTDNLILNENIDALVTNLSKSKIIINNNPEIIDSINNYLYKLEDYKEIFNKSKSNSYNQINNNMDNIMKFCFNEIIKNNEFIECSNKLNNSQYYGCHHIIANDYQVLPDFSVKFLELNGGPGFTNLKTQTTQSEYKKIWEEYLQISVYITFNQNKNNITYWEKLE